ncbi:MAG: methylenetetrahydrofolate reductase C-terminal domain-containing protein [Chloroflexi bacterium]|nr:methylenetetrahydrofolate reductase C-terminal domain-containing protein [Chloroflexota bacterium]
MIVTEQKAFTEIVGYLNPYKRLFIVGCGSCATAWHTGGETEVREMAGKLQDMGKIITGWVVVEEPCDERKTKRELQRAHAAEVAEAEALLVMACGAGTGTVAMAIPDKPIYPALNSLYLARLERLTRTDERCVLCGECVLAWTGGICPLATCPKGLLNGPCGGYKDGHCEVDQSKECAWVAIYQRMKNLDSLEMLETIHPPKDFSKMTHPRRVDKTPA